MKTSWFFIFLVGVLLFATGCPPSTPVRRTAFVPRPAIPAQAGAPLAEGDFKVHGELSSFGISGEEPTSVEDFLNMFAQEGFAGVYIPRVMIGGAAYYAPLPYLEFGGHARFTSIDWAEPNTTGVIPFPQEHAEQNLLLFGPGIRGNMPIPDIPLTISLMGEVSVVSIPQAVFLCDDPCQYSLDENGVLREPSYQFIRLDQERMLLPKLHFHVTFSPIEYVHPFAMVGAQRNVRNLGFDPNIDNLDAHTLEGYWHGDFGIGIEFRVRPAFVNVLFHMPFATQDDINFGASLGAQAGAVF